MLLLQSFNCFLGKGHFPFKEFFTWDEERKDILVEELATSLIQDWTRDLNDDDKNQVNALYKEEIKNLLREKVDQLLDRKYTTEEMPGRMSGFSIDHYIIERFKAGALEKLFENGNHEDHAPDFLKFIELPGIMSYYCKIKGQEEALALWRRLPDLEPGLTDPEPTSEYLKLLVDWVMSGEGSLNTEEKGLLSQILLINDRDEKNLDKVYLRNTSLEKLNWDQISGMLLEVMGPGWESLVANSSLLDYLLNTLLSKKQYVDFTKMTIALDRYHEESVSGDAKLIFRNKLTENIRKTLSTEFKAGKVNLLIYLGINSSIVFENSLHKAITEDYVQNFLNNLSFPELQYLLDEGLKDYPEAREKIIIRNIRNLSGSEAGLSYEKQIEFLAYLKIAKGIGEGCLAYIASIKHYHLGLDPDEMQEELIAKAKECWDSFCIPAMEGRVKETCQIFWRLRATEEFKEAMRVAFDELQGEENVELRAEKREAVRFWLSIITESEGGDNTFKRWLQDFYNEAYHAQDWETCQEFLPLFRAHPRAYYILPDIDFRVTREEGRIACKVAGKIMHEVENRELFIAILSRGMDERTFVDTRIREEADKKLKALSYLVIPPLDRVHYPGDNEEVKRLCELAQRELAQLIDPQIDHILAGVPSDKQMKLAEITGDLVQKLTSYFAQFPDDPMEAKQRYEQIIGAAQESVDQKFGTEAEFALGSFVLNALMVLLTGGLFLIAILINKGNDKPDFFSDVTTTPRAHYKSVVNTLGSTIARFGLFARNEANESEEASNEEKNGSSEAMVKPRLSIEAN